MTTENEQIEAVLILLSKSARYFYDADAIAEPIGGTMNEHQQLIIKTLKSHIGDNTARARATFSRCSPAQMNEQYGLSGLTCAEILAEYEAADAKYQAAIDWVSSIETR